MLLKIIAIMLVMTVAMIGLVYFYRKRRLVRVLKRHGVLDYQKRQWRSQAHFNESYRGPHCTKGIEMNERIAG